MNYKVKAVFWKDIGCHITEMGTKTDYKTVFEISEDRIPVLLLKENQFKRQLVKLTSSKDAEEIRKKFRTEMTVNEMLHTRKDFMIIKQSYSIYDCPLYYVTYQDKKIWNDKEHFSYEDAEETIQDILTGKKEFCFND